MSPDRELLMLAAKAAGHTMRTFWHDVEVLVPGGKIPAFKPWNPLKNDGDALRLAVKLRLDISPQSDGKVEVSNQWTSQEELRWAWESYGDDAESATRRAIVRAAAEIGCGMKDSAK